MKQGGLFCLLRSDLTNHSASCHALCIFGKLSMSSRSAWTWFGAAWSYGVEAIDYGIIFSMKTI